MEDEEEDSRTAESNSKELSGEANADTSNSQELTSSSAVAESDASESNVPGSSSENPSAKPVQVKLHFLAVGGAPILKKSKFQVRDTMTIGEVLIFLRKTLKVRETDPLFLYVNSAFAPGLDQELRSLHDCFSVNDELALQYAITSSYG